MALNFELIEKGPATQSSFCPLQVIQNLAPSTMVWRQCDIQIVQLYIAFHFSLPPFPTYGFLPYAETREGSSLYVKCQFRHLKGR